MTKISEATDFNQLRQAGLDLIRELAPESWTDHNTADPGVTLLEQLCYALTDLGYRIDFDIADLLAAGGEEAYRLLYSPRQALTTQPVIFPDFRRLLLDNVEVKNVSIRKDPAPEPKLFYAPFSEELLLQEDRDELLPEDVYRQVLLKGLVQVNVQKKKNANGVSLQQWVEKKLQAKRLLGTDFDEIRLSEEESIKIQLDIELGETKGKERLVARIWQILEQYISPSLHFQPLSDLLSEEGVEHIFEGPALAFGFLLKKQLERFQKRQEIRRSDLIRELMNLAPEIKAIRLLNIAKGNASFSSVALDWVMPLDEEKSTVFNREHSEIQFFTENLIVPFDPARADSLYLEMEEENQSSPLSGRDLDISPSVGTDRRVGHYTSIRHHLPEVYGITPFGLPETAGRQRQGQARQLSAFLLFFEQILADYFAQLVNLPKLLSVDREESDNQSYFSQALDQIRTTDGTTVEAIPAIAGIYKNTAEERIQNSRNFFEDRDDSRNSRLLDHFLARFAEHFFDNIIDADYPNANSFDQAMAAKRVFLKEYPSLSAERGTAFNYTQTAWRSANVAGTEKRIARLLGLRSYERRYLNRLKWEGFHLVEHILLRPVAGDQFQNEALLACLRTEDPYSLQLSYVFHGISRFSDEKIRRFTERLLRAETPAHLRIQTYWLECPQLSLFEKAYKTFLIELRRMKTLPPDPDEHHYSFRVARDYLMDLLYIFHPNHPDQEPHNVGIPFPLRDIPLPARAPKYQSNVAQNSDGDWLVQIQIYHPQIGVTYRLCDRDRQPIVAATPISITDSTTISYDNQEGMPYVLISTPPLDQDETFWIRAEKTVHIPATTGPIPKKLRYVFLDRPVRVRVGIAPVGVRAVPPEIDYGTQVDIELTDIQANVDYRLYADLDGNGSLELISTGVHNGPENGTIIVPTTVTGGLKEDVLITVRGSRDAFSTFADVGSTPVRVRANPVLPITIDTPIVAYGGNSGISVTSLNTGNPTQASVYYSLYYREISDPEIVHQQLSPPPNSQVEITPNGNGTDVKVLRPLIPTTVNTIPVDYEDPPISPLAYQFVETLSPANDGDPLVFNTSGLNIGEDTLFLIVASKVGHDQPIILGDGVRATIGVVLTLPDTTPTFQVDPDPVTSGNKGRVTVSNTQAGVKYYLRFSNGAKQAFNFKHDESLPSPRRDGVGFSKVDVDIVVGDVSPLPLVLETNNPLSQTVTLQLIAEKIQTGITLKIADVTLTVS